MKKFYTIEVDNENLKNTAKSKSVKTTLTASEKEVESFGIVEINNASSKGKVRSTKEVGFEKHMTNCEKKTVKSQVSQVVDYFDFSFRPETEIKVAQKAAVKKVAKKTATAKTTKTAAAKTKKDVSTVLKMEPETSFDLNAEVCERIDVDAQKIADVARLGSLFG